MGLPSRPLGIPKRIPRWAWRRLQFPARRPQAGPHKLPWWFWIWRSWRLGLRKVKPRPKSIFMYDDINVDLIPADAHAVAGYVGGHWRTWAAVEKRFPKAHHLSIAVTASEDAMCLDIENGDATPGQAPMWAARQIKRGVHRPVLYSSVSQMQSVINEMTRAGFKRSAYRIWTAHYDPRRGKHLCSSKCGFGFKDKADATQFTDRALNRSLDESICRPDFFG